MTLNVVFIHVPKTGGLTIQQALQLQILRSRHRIRNNWKNKGKVTFGHQYYLKLVRRGVVSQGFDRSAFKFAFCRNPFDRAVSHYFYVKKKHPERMNPRTSFLQMTRNLAKYGATFQPQSAYVRNIKLDFVGRFENFETDLRRVAELIDIDLGNIPQLNTTNHELHRTYYNHEIEENVRNFYKEDFNRFGYSTQL